MTLEEITADLRSLFGLSIDIDGESGLIENGCTRVDRLGYATNLTPETVKGARDAGVDLLVTHHDAWGFIYGMRRECHAALSEWGIGHFYAHLPLDAASFGTAASLIQELGATSGNGIAMQHGYPQGRMAAFDSPISLNDIAERMRLATGEACKVWACGPSTVKTFGVVTGSGALTPYVKEASDAGAQLYITGEQSLYLIQYCMSIGINLIVGSHTFTELPEVKSLAEKLRVRYPELEILEIDESHYESQPDKTSGWVLL